jgi:hypothetical protein
MANVPRAQVRKWEKQAKELAEAQSQLAKLMREQAFIRAGIPEDGAGKYFIKGYDGPDDPESIRSAAIEAGIIRASEGQQQQVDQALNGHEAAMQAASGQQAPGGGGDDLNAKLRQAKSAGEVARIAHEAGLVVEPQMQRR